METWAVQDKRKNGNKLEIWIMMVAVKIEISFWLIQSNKAIALINYKNSLQHDIYIMNLNIYSHLHDFPSIRL